MAGCPNTRPGNHTKSPERLNPPSSWVLLIKPCPFKSPKSWLNHKAVVVTFEKNKWLLCCLLKPPTSPFSDVLAEPLNPKKFLIILAVEMCQIVHIHPVFKKLKKLIRSS